MTIADPAKKQFYVVSSLPELFSDYLPTFVVVVTSLG